MSVAEQDMDLTQERWIAKSADEARELAAQLAGEGISFFMCYTEFPDQGPRWIFDTGGLD